MSGYGNNNYGGFSDQAYQEKSNKKGLATAALVLGIIGILTFWCFGFGALLAVIGIILAIIALCKKQAGKGMAVTGIILSIITIIVTGVIIAFASPIMIDLVENSDEIVEEYKEDGTVPEWLEEYQKQYPEEVKQFMDAFVQGYEEGATQENSIRAN